MDETVTMVRGIYDVFGDGDIEAVLAALHPEVEWIEPDLPAPYPVRGTYKGRDEVLAGVFATVPTHWRSFRHDLERIVAGDGTVVVLGRYDAVSTAGHATDASFAHVLDIGDGLITRFENHADTRALLAAQGICA